MKRTHVSQTVFFVAGIFCVTSHGISEERTDLLVPVELPSRSEVHSGFGQVNPYFIENRGQKDEQVRFYYRGPNHTLFLTSEGSAMVLTRSPKGTREESQATSRDNALRMDLVGARAGAELVGLDQLPGKSHFYLGNDPAKWRTNVPHYRRVAYPEIFQGIDLVYYMKSGFVEYDFVVSPGADPESIALKFDGFQKAEIDSKGNLKLELSDGGVTQKSPLIYQNIPDFGRKIIPGRYVAREDGTFGFDIEDYNPKLALTIDPVILVYSTYLGGGDRDIGEGVAVDAMGQAYITGQTASTDFPTQDPINTDLDGIDAFLTKLTAEGDALIFSTYFGGTSGDAGYAIALDADGNAYVTGSPSFDFPTTDGAFNTSPGINTDGFVAKFSADGSTLLYSTLILANTWGIDVDSEGNAYIAGETDIDSFPTKNAVQPDFGGNVDAILVKLNPEGSDTLYSTYLGGSATAASGTDRGYDVAVDEAGCAYLTGHSGSPDFPTTPGAFQEQLNEQRDAFVAKICTNGAGVAGNGTSLVYSTLLGSTRFDDGQAIGVHRGNAYVAGLTRFDDFPTQNPLQATRGGSAGDVDGFVAKLTEDGSGLVYSTFLGAVGNEGLTGLAVDGEGNAIVTGHTLGANFPIVDPVESSQLRETEVFVTKINPAGSAFVYSTLLGGSLSERAAETPGGNTIAVDREGSAYVTGWTSSTDFPTASFQETYGGGDRDAFVTKISEIFTVFFAQFGNGGGLQSDVVISNSSTGNAVSGDIEFTDDDGVPFFVDLDITGGDISTAGPVNTNQVFFTLDPLGSTTMSTTGEGGLATGAGTLTTNGRVGGTVRFNVSINNLGIIGVSASECITGFIAPVRLTASGINTGIAIYNVEDTPVTLTLTLVDQNGQEVAGGSATIENFVGRGHLSQFVANVGNPLFPDVNLPENFTGSMTVEVTGGKVAAIALEQGTQPGEFTSLQVTPLG